MTVQSGSRAASTSRTAPAAISHPAAAPRQPSRARTARMTEAVQSGVEMTIVTNTTRNTADVQNQYQNPSGPAQANNASSNVAPGSRGATDATSRRPRS